MTSPAEKIVSGSLRTLLAGLPDSASVPESEQLQGFLSGLEYFLPEVLREIHPECDSLDGIVPAWIRKSGDREAELLGLCILISDQSLTPVHLRIQLSIDADEVSWLECRLGEKQGRQFMRVPYERLNKAMHKLYLMADDVDQVDWFYKVTFGERLAEDK